MRWAAALVVPLVAIACSAEQRGALMLAVGSDHAPGVDFDRFQIQITSASSKDRYDNIVRELGQPGLVTFPATLAIVSNGDPSASVHVRVLTGTAAGGSTSVGAPRTLREIVTTIPVDRVALLRVTIDWLCVGAAKPEPDGYVESACPEGLTCIAGQCVDWTVDAAALPTFDERDVFGGECFDTTTCFAEAANALVRMDDCSVALPSGGAGANIALVVASGHGGICSGGRCLVPLDAESRHGWRAAGDRAMLPRAACDKLAEPKPEARAVVGVVTSTGCATKTERTATCGRWSSVAKR